MNNGVDGNVLRNAALHGSSGAAVCFFTCRGAERIPHIGKHELLRSGYRPLIMSRERVFVVCCGANICL